MTPGATQLLLDDPLHQPGGERTLWSTINAEENLVGVTDPLSGSFWLEAPSIGTLGAFADMGVIGEREVRYSANPDQRIGSLISGRYCVNIDLIRRLADLMPGTSGEAMERDLFGHAREGIPSHSAPWRYPVVALKAPRAAIGVIRRVNRSLPASQAWWRSAVAEMAAGDPEVAHRRLIEAHAHMSATMRPHTLGTMLTQGALERVRSLAERAGRPELELELSRGLASLEEVSMLSRLWDVSRGRADLGDFIGEYGFHGPGEGAVSNRIWREDPGALEPLIAAYGNLPEDASPAASAARVADSRRTAAKTLHDSLPARARPTARLILSYADKLWALRETGKATYLHAIDVARAASRVLGRDMEARQRISDPADVAFLTIHELMRPEGRDWREDVEYRRERREEYMTFDVPQTWEGVPTPEAPPVEEADGDSFEVVGLGASPGVVEGPVKVITDPSLDEIGPGEVLVCKTTDPSWGTLFLLASGAVIDVGAPSSHGAIVARELGIPCVINTRSGTRRLRDGDIVRVDGAAGVIRVLSRAAHSPPGM